MVHRKSTYKLAFKNLSKDIRKSIWEENSILRERRRTSELSHHSIEECDDSCDCDSVSCSDDEGEEIESEHDTHSSEEEEEEEGEEEDGSDKHSNGKGKITKNQYINGYCKYKKSTESSKEPILSSSAHKDINKIYSKVHKEDTPTRKKRISERKRSSQGENLCRERKYVSETDLNNLLRSLSTKKKRGVLKCSKATGEFDLIPARLQSVKKDGKEAATTGSQPSRHSPSYDKNVINIRPRTTIKSISRPSSSRGRPLTSNERVTFSDDDLQIASKMELKSSRKEPRIGSMSRDSNVCTGTQSLCLRCGQSVKDKGLLT